MPVYFYCVYIYINIYISRKCMDFFRKITVRNLRNSPDIAKNMFLRICIYIEKYTPRTTNVRFFSKPCLQHCNA